MMNNESLDRLCAEIMALGYSAATASRYAALIGDTPCFDEAGNIVVEENGIEFARLPLKYFDDEGN